VTPRESCAADPIADLAAAVYRRSPPVLADPSLPHQVVLRQDANKILVSCNCLRERQPSQQGTPFYRPLGVQSRWEPQQPIGLWRAHMAEVAG
jgi:hypothetical protein